MPSTDSAADKMFAAQHAMNLAESNLTDELERLGIVTEGEWEDWWTDPYDGSIEITGLPVGKELSSEQLAALWSLGFVRCWTHDVNKGELYYACRDLPKSKAE